MRGNYFPLSYLPRPTDRPTATATPRRGRDRLLVSLKYDSRFSIETNDSATTDYSGECVSYLSLSAVG